MNLSQRNTPLPGVNHADEQPQRGVLGSVKMALVSALLLGLSSLMAGNALAHSVGQVQTTKYFAPETVQMLTDRLQSGGAPGFQTNDIVTYIVQFTPLANGATTGAGGYITDYLPPGTVVVGADIVDVDSAGNFYAVAPSLPGGIDFGWGNQGQRTFSGIFATNAYDPTGRCAAAGAAFDAPDCNGRMTEVYADTGIFYSTDPRTAQFPALPTRIQQGTNGYDISPTAEGQLNPIIGQTLATTHNLWDAASTNAFGSTAAAVAALNSPKSSQVALSNSGRGAAPYYAGSAVAGPQSGYPLDYTGSTGPWQRIAYPGSRIGDAATGPAVAPDLSFTAVGGFPTNAGWNLSTANPLPSNTNAVRWAVGKLVVGSLSYVRIKLKLTSTPPLGGLVNSSEVFGGDAGDNDQGQDNAWRYHVPSVADNNSNLFVPKKVIGTCSAASVALANSCAIAPTANGGATIPASFVKLRYQITYLNSGNSTQTNVVLSDILPFRAGTAAAFSAGNVYIKSGADIRNANTTPTVQTLSNNTAAVGAPRGDVAPTTLTTANQQNTAVFQAIPSLPGGGGGVVELDVVVADTDNSALDVSTLVANTARVTTTAIPSGTTSIVNSSVTDTATLLVSKTSNVATVAPGGAITYTISIQNVGNATASAIVVRDFLPFSGTAVDATRRVNFTVGSSAFAGFTVAGTVAPVTVVPPTVAPYSSNANQQQVTWTTGKSLAAGATATITFTTTVGANVPSSATPYTNDVSVDYNDGNAAANNGATNQAPVTVSGPLTVAKTLECVYSGGTCLPYTNGPIGANAKVRYKLVYTNTGGTAQTNVFVCDQVSSTQPSPAFVVTIAQASSGTPAISDAPGIGVPTAVGSPNAACGFSPTTNAFSYPLIASLAGGATGTVYVDVTTNAANSSTLTNTAKIVSTQTVGGVSATIAHSVFNNANLVATKTTSTPTLAAGGTATYTITVTNAGNQNADNIEVYDFLPFLTAPAGATGRFNFNVGSSTFGGTVPGSPTAPTITAVAPPTQISHSGNANQQQVKWVFPVAGTLAPGASFTITFTATAGAAVPAGSTVYTNDIEVNYKSGSNTLLSGTNSQAPVTIPSSLTISKTIDCVFNAALTACNAYNGSGLIPTSAKVRYRISYANTGASAQNVLICDQLPTQIVSFAAAVSTPSIAPTPAGPFTDSPALGARTSPAAANCGLVGGISFSYPVFAMPANSTGNVYFDVQTNAATSANVVNTGKIVNNASLASETSVVSAVAINVPNLLVTKTTSTPNRSLVAPTNVATYTISVTNNGNAPTTSLKVNDFLPFSGLVNDATKRFNFNVGSSTFGGSPPVPTITTSNPPTVVPYVTNNNQQQVTWDFGNFALAAGATVTITFSATIGSTMTAPLSYYNIACGDFDSTGGAGTSCVTSALINIVSVFPPSLTFLKTTATFSDPVNNNTNPKNIPGAFIDYTLQVTNSGVGVADAVTIVDPIPADTELFTGNLSGGAPYAFTDGVSLPSGLTCSFTALNNFTDCVDFSNDNGVSFVYVPNGTFDPAVTNIRFKPVTTMSGDPVAGAPSPFFTILFRVRLK